MPLVLAKEKGKGSAKTIYIVVVLAYLLLK